MVKVKSGWDMAEEIISAMLPHLLEMQLAAFAISKEIGREFVVDLDRACMQVGLECLKIRALIRARVEREREAVGEMPVEEAYRARRD